MRDLGRPRLAETETEIVREAIERWIEGRRAERGAPDFHARDANAAKARAVWPVVQLAVGDDIRVCMRPAF
jgi:hypothetical protein